MENLEWTGDVVSDMPIPKGKGLREDTRKLLDFLSRNSGKIVKLSFESEKDSLRAYHRVRDLKKKKRVDYEAMSRRGKDLYVKVK